MEEHVNLAQSAWWSRLILETRQDHQGCQCAQRRTVGQVLDAGPATFVDVKNMRRKQQGGVGRTGQREKKYESVVSRSTGVSSRNWPCHMLLIEQTKQDWQVTRVWALL